MLTDKNGTTNVSATLPTARQPWQDTTRPVADRVADLLAEMSLAEKIAQLYGVWVLPDADGTGVAPRQDDMTSTPFDWKQLISTGLGQLTRPFGTAPVTPEQGARALAKLQNEVVAANRFGIPALVHEECLTGFMTYGATIYPSPIAWGATFDPALVETMAAQIGSSMHALGVHQGLAPVLDVTRDPRWGRTEETIGEDPVLVATIGTGYVRGLQSAGIVATLKHFVGYSASRGGRNFGPVSMGPRELADVMLVPFEMAIRDGGAGSVMHSYAEIDGVATAANRELLTDLLRERWGFAGTLVADYFGITFLNVFHHLASDDAGAGALALEAGVDVELPMVRCYGEPLLSAVRAGTVPEALVDRAVRRVLRQKCELGLLDPGWSPLPGFAPTNGANAGTAPTNGASTGTALTNGASAGAAPTDLDRPAYRDVARRLAEESVVLVSNGTGAGQDRVGADAPVLPLRPDTRIALVGPCADDRAPLLGCYSMPNHFGITGPEQDLGVTVPTLLSTMRDEFGAARVRYAQGCGVSDPGIDGIPAAVAAAAAADVCVVALGDRAGLFGRGTSGEGCDAPELRLPGVQEQLLSALLDTGTPVVLVMLSGRPYPLGAHADRLAAIVQAFFPGQEGAGAVAGVLSGRVCPSGRLPVGLPRHPGAQPYSYLATELAGRTDVSAVDPTSLYPFGHGLSYTTFAWDSVLVNGEPQAEGETAETGTDGELSVSLSVRNTGDRAGAEVVQLYLHDPVATVTRPIVRLIGYARVALEPGQSRRVRFGVSADLACLTGLRWRRVVEPGDLELRLSGSSADVRHLVRARLVGPEREVGHQRRLVAEVTVD